MTGPLVPTPQELAELRRRIGGRHAGNVVAAALGAMYGTRTVLMYGDDHQAERVARAVRETMPEGIAALITTRGPGAGDLQGRPPSVIVDEWRQLLRGEGEA